MVHIESYLSGYADGEGCFCVTFNRSKRHKFGWDIRPSFSVSQNSDRSEVLVLFKEVLGCGTIRPDRSDNTLKYEVRCMKDLVHKVIPFFEKFAVVCRKMYNHEHLTKEGFNDVVKLASQINIYGKKRYSRNEIKV